MDYTKLNKSLDFSEKKERFIYRFFEILPGFLAWATLILIILLSFLAPAIVAVFIILFDIYWLVKTVYLSLHLRQAFRKLRENLQIDWLERLHQLPTTNYQLQTIKSWQDIYHLIILPRYKENKELATASIESLLRTNYPKSKMIVVLAQEERAGEEANQVGVELEREYGNKFFQFLVVNHPSDISGEIPGKGSNA